MSVRFAFDGSVGKAGNTARSMTRWKTLAETLSFALFASKRTPVVGRTVLRGYAACTKKSTGIAFAVAGHHVQ